MKGRNKRKKVRLSAEVRKLRHAEAMLKIAEGRAQRAQTLLRRWQEKVRLLTSARREKIQPSLFVEEAATEEKLPKISTVLTKFSIHETNTPSTAPTLWEVKE